jgi:hypothetical protein
MCTVFNVAASLSTDGQLLHRLVSALYDLFSQSFMKHFAFKWFGIWSFNFFDIWLSFAMTLGSFWYGTFHRQKFAVTVWFGNLWLHLLILFSFPPFTRPVTSLLIFWVFFLVFLRCRCMKRYESILILCICVHVCG